MASGEELVDSSILMLLDDCFANGSFGIARVEEADTLNREICDLLSMLDREVQYDPYILTFTRREDEKLAAGQEFLSPSALAANITNRFILMLFDKNGLGPITQQVSRLVEPD